VELVDARTDEEHNEVSVDLDRHAPTGNLGHSRHPDSLDPTVEGRIVPAASRIWAADARSGGMRKKPRSRSRCRSGR
jgi:hypothetical protein